MKITFHEPSRFQAISSTATGEIELTPQFYAGVRKQVVGHFTVDEGGESPLKMFELTVTTDGKLSVTQLVEVEEPNAGPDLSE